MPTTYRRHLILCLAVGLLCSAHSHAGIILQPHPAFKLSIAPAKPTYQVNQALRLKANASQACYLYVFSIDEANNRAIMILPNSRQPNNHVQAQQTALVPGKGEFFSDRAGQEQVLVFASLKQLPLNPKNSHSIGDFLHGSRTGFEKALGVTLRATTTGTVTAAHANPIIVRQLAIPIKNPPITH